MVNKTTNNESALGESAVDAIELAARLSSIRQLTNSPTHQFANSPIRQLTNFNSSLQDVDLDVAVAPQHRHVHLVRLTFHQQVDNRVVHGKVGDAQPVG